MFEDQTFNVILERMLERVPDTIDKREGSLVYTALSPAAAELAQMYIDLNINLNLTFADTATDEYLSRRTSEFGVNREPATKAIRKGEFYANDDVPMDIPINSRFSIESVNFIAKEKISTGIYQMECEQAGTIGNTVFGSLLPIENINGLARAELTDVLIPGEDEETDQHLRERYYETVNEPAFGGNIADYKQKINGIDGVGATKVYPVWQGGGTVKCTIIGADWNPPSQALIDNVQTVIDPTVNQGKGIGLAPIGHEVTITGTTSLTVDVETTLTLETGMTPPQVQQEVEDVINQYLLSLRQGWANEDQIVIRVALIESAILGIQGVIDISDTKLNGNPANLTLDNDDIPMLGQVLINV